MLADDRLMMPDGMNIKGRTAIKLEKQREEMKLPHYVKNVFGSDSKDFYQEINPQLNTEERLSGINALLSQIGYKVGYSNGYFVFNEKTGMVTATQVEADDPADKRYAGQAPGLLEWCDLCIECVCGPERLGTGWAV